MTNKLDDHVKAYEGNHVYDFDNKVILNWYAKRLIGVVNEDTSLLELGLGYGYSTDIFAKTAKRHLVLEGSNAVIKNFHKNFPGCKAEIVESYFETFETDEKFNTIVMGFVLEHVDDPVAILKKYQKFLAPGGRIFASVPNAEVLNRRLGHEMGLLADMQALSEHDYILGHQRYYTAELFRADALNAGYEVVGLEGIYLKPLTTKQILSLDLDESVIDAMCKVGVDYPELCCAMLIELRLPEDSN